ncbi:MAG: V-type ATP synthase subunit A [Candidatus Odinarchaeota archaeon]
MSESMQQRGTIVRIAGPVVDIEGLTDAQLYELVRVGKEGLLGEIIRIRKIKGRTICTAQVYEETAGLVPGEDAFSTGQPLSVELGPGLIEQIYDGIQRPLALIVEATGDFIQRGVVVSPLDKKREFEFTPLVKPGDEVHGGQVIGSVPETSLITHKILVPPDIEKATVKRIEQGTFDLETVICVLTTEKGDVVDITLVQRWPVRRSRPFLRKEGATVPLLTGQRILDTFFPMAKGGTGAIPGAFGTGKCVTGDTTVYLTNGTKIPIRELFDQALKSGNIIENSEEETLIHLSDSIEVFSFDGCSIEPHKASYVYRGKSNTIYEIITRSGRKARITPVHKLLRFNGEIIEEVEARNLDKDDYLVVPAPRWFSENLSIDNSLEDNFEIPSAIQASFNSVESSDQSETLSISKSSSTTNISQDICFDKIKEINIYEEDTTVYDITVEGPHNFVGGHLGLILHNTVTQHQLAKWSDAQVVVYIGCGERGNEMTEVLKEFPELIDPHSGEKLMKRTVLIANTSNMPVAAREASVYTGITIGEYFRDQGYDVAIMADSTSRWAEALREISGRLEEMPGEEGFPAYLASKIAEFYERAGRVITLNGDNSSITVVGAVSPPGGDFSEPVTQNTLRTVGVFWALNKPLANARHFPAISWLESYSLYSDSLDEWFVNNASPEFVTLRDDAMALLQKEKELREIVQLIGEDALPESEKIILQTTRMIREFFLQQHSYSSDSYCSLDKQYKMMKAIMKFHEVVKRLFDEGVPLRVLMEVPQITELSLMKWKQDEEFEEGYEKLTNGLDGLSHEELMKEAGLIARE